MSEEEKKDNPSPGSTDRPQDVNNELLIDPTEYSQPEIQILSDEC